MLTILMLIACALACLAYRLRAQRPRVGEMLIVALALCGLVAVLIAQLWSLGRLLNTLTVALSWLALIIVLLAFCLRSAGGMRALLRRVPAGGARVRQGARTLTRAQRVLMLGLLLCFAATLFQALAYPVINWDSLNHIMPRVFFWIQRGSVGPFAASYGQQLTTYPFAAYVLTQIKLLSFGSDLFVNTAQWGAYVLACVLVAGVTHQLGGRRTSCLLSALAAATIPMAALQAVTTQYDLVVALFALASIYEIVVLRALIHQGELPATRSRLYLLALISGLGLLAKVTWLLAIWPLLLLLVATLIRHRQKTKQLLRVGTIAVVMLAFLAPLVGWFGSNAVSYQGDFMAIHVEGNAQILVPDKSPSALAVNLARNAFMEVGTPIKQINTKLVSGAQAIAHRARLDLNMPADKETSSTPYALNAQITNHDRAAAPLTVILLCVTLVVLIRYAKRSFQARKTLGYLGLVALGFCSTAMLVTWQPFITRTLVVSLLALTPAVGCAFEVARKRSGAGRIGYLRIVLIVVLGLTALLACLVILFNTTNPLLPTRYLPGESGRNLGFWNTSRADLSFETLTPSLGSTVHFLEQSANMKSVKRIGLTGDAIKIQPLYPLLMPLMRYHVTVLPEATVDGTRRLVDPETLPPDLILDFTGRKPRATLAYHRLRYLNVHQVYLPETQAWLTLYRRASPGSSK